MFRLLLSFFLVALMPHLSLRAQGVKQDGLQYFVDNVKAFNQLFPQEKVYLHFDNHGYYMGETIWFKAYLVRTDKALPSDISKVLYVELVSPNGDVLLTRKLKVEDGQAWGELPLTDLLESGYYEVRAYTRYMTNWGKEVIFSRLFPVFDKPKQEGDYTQQHLATYSRRMQLPSTREEADQKQKKLNVRFYPEGGHLIKGKTCRVAFDVKDALGADGTALSIRLLDETGEVKEDGIQLLREGRGVFTCVPDGSPLYLEIKNERGKMHRFLLPQSESQGVALTLNALSARHVTLQLDATDSVTSRLLGVALMHNGQVVTFDTVSVADGPSLQRFARAELPEGVSQLTVFDADGRIWADRMLFIPPHDDTDTIGVSLVQRHLMPCGKMELNLTSQPQTTFSLSVLDAATVPCGNTLDVRSWMLLTSDLKGFIRQPSYYFEADDVAHRQAADLLMMVQGWRRYDWAQMSGTSPFEKKQPIDDQLYLDGQLNAARKRWPVNGVELKAILYNQGGESMQGNTVTDSTGHYAFALPNSYGPFTLMMYTKKDDKLRKYYVGINRQFAPACRAISYDETHLPPVEPLRMVLNESEEADKVYVDMTKKDHLMPTLQVKRRRIYDNARAGWENENVARHKASVYYDCSLEADKIADRGEDIPFFTTWLRTECSFFKGQGNPDYNNVDGTWAPDVSTDATDAAATATAATPSVTGAEVQPSTGSSSKDDEMKYPVKTVMASGEAANLPIFDGGQGYNNRPIVWILNNRFYGITNLQVAKLQVEMVNDPTTEALPDDLDEAKSVYISDDPNAYKPFILSSQLAARNPITLFVYTYHSFPSKVKGLRRTFFQGYNRPTTFESNDYSILPPEADYRRTLYWNPNVSTDAQGKAKVSFWNNSGCTQVVISAEGVSGEGAPLLYK